MRRAPRKHLAAIIILGATVRLPIIIFACSHLCLDCLHADPALCVHTDILGVSTLVPDDYRRETVLPSHRWGRLHGHHQPLGEPVIYGGTGARTTAANSDRRSVGG